MRRDAAATSCVAGAQMYSGAKKCRQRSLPPRVRGMTASGVTMIRRSSGLTCRALASHATPTTTTTAPTIAVALWTQRRGAIDAWTTASPVSRCGELTSADSAGSGVDFSHASMSPVNANTEERRPPGSRRTGRPSDSQRQRLRDRGIPQSPSTNRAASPDADPGRPSTRIVHWFSEDIALVSTSRAFMSADGR